ncbi:hypothetical protein L195_g053078, partial [Trifolium pratense]
EQDNRYCKEEEEEDRGKKKKKKKLYHSRKLLVHIQKTKLLPESTRSWLEWMGSCDKALAVATILAQNAISKHPFTPNTMEVLEDARKEAQGGCDEDSKCF